MLEKKKEKGINIMELVERRDHHWRLFSLIGLNENNIFSTNKQTKKKKMKHYRVETVELFSLVLVRYKNCLFQQEDFDLPTFAMPAAPQDSAD